MLSRIFHITLIILIAIPIFANAAEAKGVDSRKPTYGRKPAVTSIKRHPMSKANKNKLFLEFLAGSESRGQIFKIMSGVMSSSDYRFALDIAQKQRVDLRAPISFKISDNGTMTLGEKNEKVIWDNTKNSLVFRGEAFSHNKNLSMKENFKLVEARLRSKSAFIQFFISEAHAEAVSPQALTDLNYVLYVMAHADDQAALDKLGPNYAEKFDAKLRDLIQKYKFQTMRCDAGAHSANATMIFGENADIEVSIQDLGTGEKSLVTRQGGQIVSEEPIPAKKKELMDGLFDELCINNDNNQLLEKGSTIHSFGGVAQ
ncbi:MAG: hypothetical protein IT287_02540 [Bdellovibrionaceae bacterium]|nr:hypothetical protein [Pseudobdellovibrionaceae bacterium]